MTLVSTEALGVVGVISKAAEIDEAGAKQLLRLGIYEALCDLSDQLQPEVEREAAMVVAKQSEEGRRALVRTFIDRRARGEQVGDVLKAAAMMTLVEVGKASEDDPKTSFWDARDAKGRFRAATAALDRATQSLKGMDDESRKGPYGAMRTAGAVMAATGDPTTSAAGMALAAAGAFGPEAERVLGPGIQRAAYRYRGTERRPTRQVVKPLQDAKQLMEAAGSGDREALGRIGAEIGNEQVASTLAHYSPKNAGAGMTGEQRRLAILGDTAAATLMQQLPTMEAARTSIATGRIPPSRGVLIDDEGDIVSEAVGMNGDHYVPFDLKNLGRLEGGQYVRTRVAGGPTTEDIYTGLMSGARQVQVVSHSGVFTLELDPQLRGSRRYSDKARSMVRRYEEILAGIGSSRVTEIELPAEEKARLRQQAINRTGSVAEAKEKYRELEQERMAELQFERDEEAQEALVDQALDAELKRRRTQPSRQELARIRRDVENDLRDQGKIGPRALQLNGEGYARALEALATEFPYFIRDVRHDTLRDFADTRGIRTDAKLNRGGTDQGYVAPGRNLARASAREDLTRRERTKTTEAAGAAEEAADGTKKPAGNVPVGDRATTEGDNAGLPNFGAAKRHKSKPLEGALASADLPPKARNAPADAFRDIAAAAEEIENGAIGSSAPRNEVSDYTLDYLETRPAYEVVRYVAAKGGAKALVGKDADPRLVGIFNKAMEELRDTIDQRSFKDEEVPQKAANGMEFFEDFSALVKPFGAAATKTTLVGPLGEDGKPLKIPAIVSLGTDLRNYQAWEDDANSDTEMKRLLEEGNFLTKIRQLSRAKSLLTKYVDDEDSDAQSPIKGIENKRDAKNRLEEMERVLPKLHYAYAFDTAKNAASQLAKLMSEEGEQSPTPTRPPLTTVSARWERGRPAASATRVRVHPPGSPLATEFAKFLASRR